MIEVIIMDDHQMLHEGIGEKLNISKDVKLMNTFRQGEYLSEDIL